jgi:hypothetical protein
VDWWDLTLKLLPAVTALIGAFAGAIIAPLIARRTSLDTAKFNIEGQRALALEEAARANQAADRQARHDLLEPLLASAREHARDVENAIHAAAAVPPGTHVIPPRIPGPSLREDLRWSAVPSTRFQAALGHYQRAKTSLRAVLVVEFDKRDENGLPSKNITDKLGRLKTTVLDLHDTAEAYIRDGPDTPPA